LFKKYTFDILLRLISLLKTYRNLIVWKVMSGDQQILKYWLCIFLFYFCKKRFKRSEFWLQMSQFTHILWNISIAEILTVYLMQSFSGLFVYLSIFRLNIIIYEPFWENHHEICWIIVQLGPSESKVTIWTQVTFNTTTTSHRLLGHLRTKEADFKRLILEYSW
jgi:hypothetical protein